MKETGWMDRREAVLFCFFMNGRITVLSAAGEE